MLKKILLSLLLASLLIGAALPVLAQSVIPDQCTIKKDTGIANCPGAGSPCPYATNELCGLCCMISTIFYVADWIFTFLMIIVILFVLWGAFDILQAAGDAERINKGRDRIMYAAVGLGIALMAKAIPAVVKYMVAGS